jgi:murein DD-endopeptidase MepM/ murein hydrolase activator NlpD
MQCDRKYGICFVFILISFLFFSSMVLAELNSNVNILGKWERYDTKYRGKETIKFWKDGTISSYHETFGFCITGNYKFINTNNVKIEFGGIWGITGPNIYEVSVSDNNLVLTSIDGKESRFHRLGVEIVSPNPNRGEIKLKGSHKYVKPCPDAGEYHGWREGKNGNHLGHDFNAPLHTHVKSIADGVVYDKIFTLSKCYDPKTRKEVKQNFIWIEHQLENGEYFYALYGHLEPDPSIIKGTKIMAGQYIGKIVQCYFKNNNKYDSVPHLHFGIWKSKSPPPIKELGYGDIRMFTDPIKFLEENRFRHQIDISGTYFAYLCEEGAPDMKMRLKLNLMSNNILELRIIGKWKTKIIKYDNKKLLKCVVATDWIKYEKSYKPITPLLQCYLDKNIIIISDTKERWVKTKNAKPIISHGRGDIYKLLGVNFWNKYKEVKGSTILEFNENKTAYIVYYGEWDRNGDKLKVKSNNPSLMEEKNTIYIKNDKIIEKSIIWNKNTIKKMPPVNDYNDNLTQGFGAYLGSYAGNNYFGYHSGEDIALVAGTPVYAIADGHVAKISDLANLGYLIALEHQGSFHIPERSEGVEGQSYHYPGEEVDTLYSVYIHVDHTEDLSENSWVEAGKKIGEIADISAAGLGAHLHFEIRHPDQVPSGNWSMIGDSSNWRKFENGLYNGYYKNLQQMTDAGLRHPSDFLGIRTPGNVDAPHKTDSNRFDLNKK